jgi:hypothetical protein
MLSTYIITLRIMSSIDAKAGGATIYCIMNSIDSATYVGCTTQSIDKRFAKHKRVARRPKANCKLHHHILKLGAENFFIFPLLHLKAMSRESMRREEGFVIKMMKSELNMRIAGQTAAEHNADPINRARKKKLEAAYHKANVKHRNATSARNYQNNKVSKAAYNKIYQQEHAEQIASKKHDTYQANKAKYHLRTGVKCNCECGGKFTVANKSTHVKTGKHVLFLACKQN